jgi:hypothetical protein
MIRENQNIRGIIVHETENKIVQYADDTELTMEGDRNSFEEAVNTIQNFGKKSGLVLNTDKSSAIWLGSMRNSELRFMPHLRMEWNPERFKILGIWFTNDCRGCVEINFKEKFAEIKNMFKVWLKRQITPLGRVAVLKSLILSKLVHLWLLLPNPPDVMINQIQGAVYWFVWGKKNDKISRKVSVKRIECGGIGIPDVRKFMNALKITWLRKLKVSYHKWINIVNVSLGRIDLFYKLGTVVDKNVKVNNFWLDVLKAYKELGTKILIENNDDIRGEPVFCNANIFVGGEILFYRNWVEKGVYNIGHFLKDDGTFFDLHTFRTKYGILVDFLTYSGCVNAIKQYICKIGVDVAGEHFQVYENSKVFRFILSVLKGARPFYDVLVQTEQHPNCCKNWEERLEIKVPWKAIFKKIKRIKDTKLKWFQTRVVHRILGTNTVLHNMGLATSNSCTFCGLEKENIQHLLWSCTFVQQFWINLQNVVVNKCSHAASLHFTEHLVLFGCDKLIVTDDVIDFLIVLAKMYIYKCKMNKELPLYEIFLITLKNRYVIEKYIASIQMCIDDFCVLWQLYLPLFDGIT